MRCFASVDDLTIENYFEIFHLIRKVKWVHQRDKAAFLRVAQGHLLTLAFWEPSTRTARSFELAMKFMGGLTYDFRESVSSRGKGESVSDTMSILAQGSGIMVTRTGEHDFARHFSETLGIPIINAGEGTLEHPNQAVLDMFTIWEYFGYPTDLKGLKIALYGDLARGRTVHSLIKLAARMGMKITCVAPDNMQMPSEYVNYVAQFTDCIQLAPNIEPILPNIDILYVVRAQNERPMDGISDNPYETMAPITSELLKVFNTHGILMHPMPIGPEIDRTCNEDPRAFYLAQAHNGIYTRMVILAYYLDLMGKLERTCKIHEWKAALGL